MGELITIIIGTVLINNFVLHYFLGICPFLGVSSHYSSAFGMGMAVIFVMSLTSAICWILYHFVLVKFNIVFLEYVVFIFTIATLVQIVEMFIRKYSSALYEALGIYLPLITTNCCILGLALFLVMFEYNFIESVIFGFSAGLGFSLVLIIMAGIREELKFVKIPKVFKGAPITLIIAGILALTFMGFSGIIK